LDEATRKQLDRGRMFTELMKQAQYAPLSISDMALTLLAANKGYFDDVPVARALAFEAALHSFMHSKYKKLMDKIETTKDLAGDDETAVEAAIQDFKANNAY
jgi:F-type H+/Na+-transporting ATPase subunit alpha